MREVKVYRVAGVMNLHRSRERRKFVIEVPALKAEHAVEKVLSELGSRHKLKRCHIIISEVKEVSENEVSREHVRELLGLDRIVVG